MKTSYLLSLSLILIVSLTAMANEPCRLWELGAASQPPEGFYALFSTPRLIVGNSQSNEILDFPGRPMSLEVRAKANPSQVIGELGFKAEEFSATPLRRIVIPIAFLPESQGARLAYEAKFGLIALLRQEFGIEHFDDIIHNANFRSRALHEELGYERASPRSEESRYFHWRLNTKTFDKTKAKLESLDGNPFLGNRTPLTNDTVNWDEFSRRLEHWVEKNALAIESLDLAPGPDLEIRLAKYDLSLKGQRSTAIRKSRSERRGRSHLWKDYAAEYWSGLRDLGRFGAQGVLMNEILQPLSPLAVAVKARDVAQVKKALENLTERNSHHLFKEALAAEVEGVFYQLRRSRIGL